MGARVVGERPRRGPGRPIGGGWTRDEGRAALVMAAEACFARYGVPETTIGDVAAEAGVSPATVYRYFSGRDDLLEGVLVSVTDRILTEVDDIVVAAESLADLIVDVLVRAGELMTEDPVLSAVFTGTDRVDAETLAVGSTDVRTGIAEFIEWSLSQRPDLDREVRVGLDHAELAAHLIRIVFSITGTGSDLRGDPVGQRRYLRTFVLPALLEERPPLPDADEIDIRPVSVPADASFPDQEAP